MNPYANLSNNDLLMQVDFLLNCIEKEQNSDHPMKTRYHNIKLYKLSMQQVKAILDSRNIPIPTE